MFLFSFLFQKVLTDYLPHNSSDFISKVDSCKSLRKTWTKIQCFDQDFEKMTLKTVLLLNVLTTLLAIGSKGLLKSKKELTVVNFEFFFLIRCKKICKKMQFPYFWFWHAVNCQKSILWKKTRSKHIFYFLLFGYL